jgi:DNA gyrase subunit A
MVITVSHMGYVKRVPLSTYRRATARRQGQGGHADPRRGFRHPAVCRLHSRAGAVFLLAWPVYKEKVWRLPQAAPQARGKALINILPLEQGELITTIMPLPEDETTWGKLDVMFATTRGTVRRNKLSDFVDVRRSGIIA